MALLPREEFAGAGQVLAVPEWDIGLGPPTIVDAEAKDNLPESLKQWRGVGIGDYIHPRPDKRPRPLGILLVADSGTLVRIKSDWESAQVARIGPRIKASLLRIFVTRDNDRYDRQLALRANFGDLTSDPEAMVENSPETILGEPSELSAMATFLEALPTDGDDQWQIVEVDSPKRD